MYSKNYLETWYDLLPPPPKAGKTKTPLFEKVIFSLFPKLCIAKIILKRGIIYVFSLPTRKKEQKYHCLKKFLLYLHGYF
ncbi:MAG: hypothetical protein LBR79_01560 [Oscillospiraceae bacterium]|nr:hypothetical protein [Oscillospiraceae bacterium]